MRKRVFYNPVIKDRATLLKSSEDTGGEYTLLKIEVAPGGGNSEHTHNSFSEKFRVVKGTLSVTLGRDVKLIRQGEAVTVDAKAVHCFKNETADTVEFLVEFRPGQPGFEKAIAIAYGLAADGLVDKDSAPKNLVHLSIVSTLAQSFPTGFLSILMPVFRFVASLAKRTEAALTEKYC